MTLALTLADGSTRTLLVGEAGKTLDGQFQVFLAFIAVDGEEDCCVGREVGHPWRRLSRLVKDGGAERWVEDTRLHFLQPLECRPEYLKRKKQG